VLPQIGTLGSVVLFRSQLFMSQVATLRKDVMPQISAVRSVVMLQIALLSIVILPQHPQQLQSNTSESCGLWQHFPNTNKTNRQTTNKKQQHPTKKVKTNLLQQEATASHEKSKDKPSL
jgi:hypothetical protein